jgi:hypothetical protein
VVETCRTLDLDFNKSVNAVKLINFASHKLNELCSTKVLDCFVMVGGERLGCEISNLLHLQNVDFTD